MPTNYNKYLQSDKWNSIKEKVLRRDNHICQECGNTDKLIVHHKTYEHIFKEAKYLDDLVILCKECHWKVHSPGEHSKFGPYVAVGRCYKFTKVFHHVVPKFSKKIYEGLWFRLTIHLSKNTNIIYTIKKGKIYLVRTRQELIKICDIGRSTLYSFIKECIEKSYLAEWKCNETFFIVNPKYSLNGKKIPQVFLDLFENPLKDKSNEE